MTGNAAQHTLEWFRARHGNITGKCRPANEKQAHGLLF